MAYDTIWTQPERLAHSSQPVEGPRRERAPRERSKACPERAPRKRSKGLPWASAASRRAPS